jgi:hypothetical protein
MITYRVVNMRSGGRVAMIGGIAAKINTKRRTLFTNTHLRIYRVVPRDAEHL